MLGFFQDGGGKCRDENDLGKFNLNIFERHCKLVFTYYHMTWFNAYAIDVKTDKKLSS